MVTPFITIVAASAISATDGFIHNKTVNELRGIPFQSTQYPLFLAIYTWSLRRREVLLTSILKRK